MFMLLVNDPAEVAVKPVGTTMLVLHHHARLALLGNRRQVVVFNVWHSTLPLNHLLQVRVLDGLVQIVALVT